MRLSVVDSEKLDQHLLEIVGALRRAVKQGVSHSNEPKIAERAIDDCKEILTVIMAGNVSEWLN
jgi:hypothetical protein